MCAKDFSNTPVGDIESLAWRLYEQTLARLRQVTPSQLPEPGEDGSQQMNLTGVISSPSPGEMRGLGLCLSWALEFWSTSQTPPEGDRLFSFARSEGVGPVGCIIMPLSMSMLMSWSILIASGENDQALQLLGDMIPNAEPHTTAPPTSPKTIPDSESGTSSTIPGNKVLDVVAPKFTSSPDLERHTSPSSNFKKKKAGKKKKTHKRGSRKQLKDSRTR